MMVSIREALNKATVLLERRGIDSPRIEAEILAGSTLGVKRAHLYLEAHQLLSMERAKTFWQAVETRLKGTPLQYILKTQPFRYLDLKVSPGVFIPRPETELLVEYTISTVQEKPKGSESITFIDIGTGTGAIALSLAYELPNASGWAVDISKTALDVACENAKECGLEDRVNFIESNFFDGLSDGLHGQIDLVISNPPYVHHDEISKLQTEVKDFEPIQSLDGGLDGLHSYCEIAASSPVFLRKGGILALEIGKDQAEAVTNLLNKTRKFSHIKVFKDYAAIDRVVVARCS